MEYNPSYARAELCASEASNNRPNNYETGFGPLHSTDKHSSINKFRPHISMMQKNRLINLERRARFNRLEIKID